MGPSRWPYGTGRGFVNNFNYRGNTAGLFTSGDATPDVTIGGLFYTNNTAATTITYLDMQEYGSRAADYEGKEITIFFLDSNTTIANAGQLYLASTSNAFMPNQSITFMQSRSAWFEIDRATVTRNDSQVFSLGGTTSFNADGTRIAYISGTAATTIQAISGGQHGQSLILIAGSGALTINTAGNIALAGTNAIVLRALDRLDITRYGSTWYLGRTQ